MNWLLAEENSVLMIALSMILIYITLVTLTRLGGLRSFSKMSAFDFALTVAIGSVIGSTIVAQDPPVVNGALALAVLFAVKIGLAQIRWRISFVADLLDNPPSPDHDRRENASRTDEESKHHRKGSAIKTARSECARPQPD